MRQNIKKGRPAPIKKPASNRATQTHKDAHKFEVKRGLNGLGLYARVPFKRGERVIEYTGEHLTEEEAEKRGGQYLFDVSKKLTIDGSGRENLARYINHSCKRQNCRPEINASETRVFIFAKRAIAPGEELTYNYGKEFWNEYIKPKGCRCPICTQTDAT